MVPLRGIVFALGSALLFGASTPLAKALVGTIDPLWLAGLLYAGSGLGLTLVLFVRVARDGRGNLTLPRADLAWLALTILCGGVLAPALFTFGLRLTSGAAASLLGNLENVMTVALAWFASASIAARGLSPGWWPSLPHASSSPGRRTPVPREVQARV